MTRVAQVPNLIGEWRFGNGNIETFFYFAVNQHPPGSAAIFCTVVYECEINVSRSPYSAWAFPTFRRCLSYISFFCRIPVLRNKRNCNELDYILICKFKVFRGLPLRVRYLPYIDWLMRYCWWLGIQLVSRMSPSNKMGMRGKDENGVQTRLWTPYWVIKSTTASSWKSYEAGGPVESTVMEGGRRWRTRYHVHDIAIDDFLA